MTDVRTMVELAHREDEEAKAQALATSLGLRYVNLVGYPFSPTLADMITPAEQREYLVAAYRRAGDTLFIASPEPERSELQAWLTTLAARASVTPDLGVCSASSLAEASHFYATHPAVPLRDLSDQVSDRRQSVDQALKTFRDPAALAAKLEGITTSEQLDILFAGAMAMDATDIHIEPAEQGVLIRFRIDGVLREIARLSLDHYLALRSRIKYLAHLTLDVVAKPQDGRFAYQTVGRQFDVRVSSLPTGYGETFVLRLLVGGTIITLDELGYSPEQVGTIKAAMHRPNGLILITGPTGSGKTTTLYAILAELNTPDVKIITIEDPIEYRIEGIEQSQVDEASGYSFAMALRSALRQDPDIMMVGEIRDPETATIAIQAAMTGHLVLATLHTNSAAGAIPRLLDMGVKTYLLGGVINLIIAQRLVRRLADSKVEGDERYKGRIAIAELLVPNHNIETLMQQKASVDDFAEAAQAAGMQTMFADGMEKARGGITTEEEVRRVAEDMATPG